MTKPAATGCSSLRASRPGCPRADQGRDLAVQVLRIDRSAPDQREAACRVDEERLGESGHPIGVAPIAPVALAELRIGEPVLMGERDGVLDRVVEVDSEHREPIFLVAALEGLECRGLAPAWLAPRRPEVDEDPLAAVVRDVSA